MWLLVIIGVALGLRLYRLDFGLELPYLAHTDEPTQYNPALRIVQSGDLNPHFFNYPSLTIYLHAAVMYVAFWLGRLAGVYRSLADLEPIRTLEMAVGVVGTPAMLLLGRATTAVIGTLTVGVVWLATRRLCRRAWLAGLAALMLALSSGHIRLSHYMTVDVIATFFAVACVTACVWSGQDRRFLWLAAVCGGLAASGKYNYAVLAVSVGLAGLLYPASWLNKAINVLVCGVLFGLAFAVTSPFVLLDWEHAVKGIRGEMEHYATGHLGFAGNSLTWYLGYLWQVNPFYLLAGGPGLALSLWRGKRAAWPMVVFVVVYFGLIGMQVVHFDRNVLPVLVLSVVGAAIAVDALLDMLPARRRDERWSRVRLSLLTVGLVVIPLIPSLWSLPAFLRPPQPSGKALAQTWFDRILPMTAGRQFLQYRGGMPLKIAAEAYTVYLDPKQCQVDYMSTLIKFSGGLSEIQSKGYDMVIIGSGMFNRFYADPKTFPREVRFYDQLLQWPDRLAFENPPDPLEFIPAGSKVYVIFLTERARQFKQMSDLYSQEVQ